MISLFLIVVFSLDLAIIVYEIVIDGMLTHVISLFLKFIQFSNVAQEVLFLFALKIVGELVHFHLFSHLSKMFFHNLVVGIPIFIVNFLAELNDISWIDEFFVVSIANVSDTLVLWTEALRIRVRHMETL
jgi:hypothetical protein